MDEQQRSRWRRIGKQILWTVGAVVAVSAVVFVLNHFFVHRPLWDWLKLLVVPAVIAGGGLWFNRQQRKRELEIAERRTQDEALQAYLDQMSDMLLPNKDQPSLYKARPGDSLSSVGRARTLTVLPRLDGNRKARVVQFLREAGLIAKRRPILTLRGADLRGASLGDAFLIGTDLSAVFLIGADLGETYLDRADLSYAILEGAELIMTSLEDADLSYAVLIGADLRDTYLRGANLKRANLEGANLEGANLSGANLEGANLRGVLRLTGEQLEDAGPLEGATMPNGQKYEDWHKDKENRKK